MTKSWLFPSSTDLDWKLPDMKNGLHLLTMNLISLSSVCTPAQLNELNSCGAYVEFGFCEPDSLFFSFALQNCFFSCGFCQRKWNRKEFY